MTAPKLSSSSPAGRSSGHFPESMHRESLADLDRERSFRYFVSQLAIRGIRIAELLMEGESRKSDYLREAARLLDLADAPKVTEDVMAIWKACRGAEFVLNDREAEEAVASRYRRRNLPPPTA